MYHIGIHYIVLYCIITYILYHHPHVDTCCVPYLCGARSDLHSELYFFKAKNPKKTDLMRLRFGQYDLTP